MAKAVSPCAPSDALTALAAQLEERGLTRLYAATSGHVGVLSVEAGVTVWTNGKVLCWHIDGEETRLPAADPMYAARTLIRLMGMYGHKPASLCAHRPQCWARNGEILPARETTPGWYERYRYGAAPSEALQSGDWRASVMSGPPRTPSFVGGLAGQSACPGLTRQDFFLLPSIRLALSH